MAISRGLLKDTLTLQRVSLADDGTGGRIATWSDVGSFKGRISPIRAEEMRASDKLTMETTHRIYCDPMTVNADDRIRWGTYYFEIIRIINPSEWYRHLEIDVKEIHQP